MVSIDNERNAAEQAQTAIGKLKLSPSENVGPTIEILRIAQRAATSAGAGPTLSSEGSLNEARAEVGIAFPDLINRSEERRVGKECRL